MSSERRGSPRSSIDCQAEVLADAASYAARVSTISRLGALMCLERVLPVGTPLSLLLEVPGWMTRLQLHGQVVRAEASGGVAVTFGPLTTVAMAKLETLIANLGT